MRVFLNPGHAPNGIPDPGACGLGLRESDVAAAVTSLTADYLAAAGVEVAGILQSDSLGEIVSAANASGADAFISVHCNAFNGRAQGTETCVYSGGGRSAQLGQSIQGQIVSALGTVDRGIKERPGLYVLNSTSMPAVLVELAFIDNEHDNDLLKNEPDEFARAIARGVTDYQNL